MNLIGKKVQHKNTRQIGEIIDVSNGFIVVSFFSDICRYKKEEAFKYIELEDEYEQRSLENQADEYEFLNFKQRFCNALDEQIRYLYSNGGKKYHATDGIFVNKRYDSYIYAFDSDEELHLPDGTEITIISVNEYFKGKIISCEEYTVIIQANKFMGKRWDDIRFVADQSFMLKMLKENFNSVQANHNPIAYSLACMGEKYKKKYSDIKIGQDIAINKALRDNIVFIWGPPGTGKTQVLANISLDAISRNKRVLMISYSNVSVDGALLRVAKMSDQPKGTILRYGYPRMEELLANDYLTSYSYVLNTIPGLAKRYSDLQIKKKRLKKKSPEFVEVKKELNSIKRQLIESEKQVIQKASFVATTVSKAIMDAAINTQQFDYVIFDEASMAYVPQIVFAASLTKTHFVCLGDFRQLPAIVPNTDSSILCQDIFEHVGITDAVENNYDHEWLVMLSEQYRMHPDIARVASENMYSGKLTTSPKIITNRNEIAKCGPLAGHAIGLVDLSYMYSACGKTIDGSHFNVLSALISMRIAEKVAEKYKVAIITPYNAQSRLLMSMIRDAKERNKNFKRITTATVHQFQGSENPVIIYDFVDCFRMSYLGKLLTSMTNNTANRLFNVAFTRAQGKMIIVGNRDYLVRKRLSKKLFFANVIDTVCKTNNIIAGEQAISYLTKQENQNEEIYITEKGQCWHEYLKDIEMAKNNLWIAIPGSIEDDNDKLKGLKKLLDNLNKKNINIQIHVDSRIDLPEFLKQYIVKVSDYIINPLTVIDDDIVWFGQPLSEPNFITDNGVLWSEYFPAIRFEGKITVKVLKSFIS